MHQYCRMQGIKIILIHYVSDLRQVSGFLRVLRFPPPISLHDRHDITEIFLHFSQIRFFYPIFKFYRGKKRSLFVTNITEIPIKNIYNTFIEVMVFNVTFNNISVISWRSCSDIGGGNRSTRRKPLTCRKSLT
jgi:hypothetical protein